jgi:Lrp/AsnC family transcriptional regulator, leucine-responsive regulatory protein
MAVENLDDVDWRLLEALQRDGRASYADLGRLVGLSPSAVTERVRRLEDTGVITGSAAEVDPEKLGLTIMALEVGEAHHVTGEDCFVLTVRARSMRHLEEVTGRISGLGAVTTSVVYSSPLPRRPVVGSAIGASAAAASASRRRA